MAKEVEAPPARRVRGKYCHFYWDHDHDTNDCFNLKEQIEELIQWVRLQRFVTTQKIDEINKQQSQLATKEKEGIPPLSEIRVIAGGFARGGEFASAWKAHLQRSKQMKGRDVYMIQRLVKQTRKTNCLITFLEEDSTRLQHPHDDTLIVIIMIVEYMTWRVLIDNGSFVDILYLPIFKHMGIPKNRLHPIRTPLVGFMGDKIFPLGSIALSVIVGFGA